jgi:hypothetical protein
MSAMDAAHRSSLVFLRSPPQTNVGHYGDDTDQKHQQIYFHFYRSARLRSLNCEFIEA